MPTAPEAPDAEQIRRVRLDAAALCQVVAAADLPSGLVVIDLPNPPEGMHGAVIGSGHEFARWAGDKLGRQGIGVAVGYLIELCRTNRCTEFLQPMAEAVALHETAHILWGTDRLDAAHIGRVMADLAPSAVLCADPAKRAADHPVQWAATLTILAERAMIYRPRTAASLAVCVQSDLEAHGYSHQQLQRVLGLVHSSTSVIDLLHPGGLIMQRLATHTPHLEPSKQDTTQHSAVLAACHSLR